MQGDLHAGTEPMTLQHVVHPAEILGSLVAPGAPPILPSDGHREVLRHRARPSRGCSMTVFPGETVTVPGQIRLRQEHVPALSQLPGGTGAAGVVEISGVRVEADPLRPRHEKASARIRQLRLHAGMVFQEFNLFPHLSVLGNLIEAPIHAQAAAAQGGDRASPPRGSSPRSG
ncbi:MAG: hypothetical protein WKF78_02575 [Candidatus Limnocylindrales bacterium]